MRTGQASGLQIAFLVAAAMLLATPLSRAVIGVAALDGTPRFLVETGGHLFLACALVAAIPPMRRAVAEMLRVTIPRSMWTEVAAAGLLKLTAAFGGIAALALWFIAQGPEWAEKMVRNIDRQIANSYSSSGLAVLFLSSVIGPLVEEVVFRGFIYRAFERQWGWIVSLVATSAVFGVYHAHFWSAFTGSVIMICLLRRTGSLRAPILIHMAFNFLLWPPFLGQYTFPRPEALTDPSNWLVHGICLGFASVAVPVYVYMARDSHVAPTMFMEPNAALPK